MHECQFCGPARAARGRRDRMAVDEANPKLDRTIKERKEYAECNYDFDEDDGYTDEDAIDDLMDERGQDREGYCSLAGTEYCSFECPFRD